MDELSQEHVNELEQLHPADIADQLQRFTTEEAVWVVRLLPRKIAAESIAELESERACDLLEKLTVPEVAAFLKHLPPSEATDLLNEIPKQRQQEILDQVSGSVASPIKELLSYPEDTAGGIMSDRFLVLRSDETVATCQERLRREQRFETEDISYLYATNEAGKLLGVVPLRDLVFSKPSTPIRDLIKDDVTFLRVDDDQEEIARKFERYHYLGLPVLDAEDRLVGVVKASAALEIAQEEATEDMQLMVGLSGEERVLTPWHKAMAKRLPWLYLNLATACAAAAVVGLFQNTINQWTYLAVFLPIIAGQGGNAGMQTLTVIIRDLALGELNRGDGWHALAKEMLLGLANGLAIGLVVGILGYFWKNNITLGVVAGSAMLLNQLAAALSGVLVPFGLKFFRVDPALASSIFVTTITDVAGFFFFLGLATIALRLAAP